MKLYFTPGACSLASHIAAREAGVPIELERVDLRAKRTAGGEDFTRITAKGYVPALRLDDGEVLTEGVAISQYIADLAPASGLAPAHGSRERYRLQEWLAYINSELHKSYSPLFNPATPDAVRDDRKAYLQRRYALVEQQLAGRPYLLGEQFTIADAYLFTVTRWAALHAIDLSMYPALMQFQQRVEARPAVQAALQAEAI